MSKESKAKKVLYLTTQPIRAGQLYRQITEMAQELLPSGEIKVTCPDMQKLEQERDSALKMLEEMAGALKDCAHQAMIRGDERQRDLVKDALTRYNQWKEGMK